MVQGKVTDLKGTVLSCVFVFNINVTESVSVVAVLHHVFSPQPLRAVACGGLTEEK
jgi:hypothetical protein